MTDREMLGRMCDLVLQYSNGSLQPNIRKQLIQTVINEKEQSNQMEAQKYSRAQEFPPSNPTAMDAVPNEDDR